MKWEAIAVLHAAGDELEPERLLKKYSIANATAYRMGEAAGRRAHAHHLGLQDAGITVQVTGYPCMDEEGEEEAAQQRVC